MFQVTKVAIYLCICLFANLIHMILVMFFFLSFLQVAQSFLTALQNDERANYQLDVKFQESYLNKVVSLLQCQLSEGAVTDKDMSTAEAENKSAEDGTSPDEIEEGELPDSYGGSFSLLFYLCFVTLPAQLVTDLLMILKIDLTCKS